MFRHNEPLGLVFILRSPGVGRYLRSVPRSWVAHRTIQHLIPPGVVILMRDGGGNRYLTAAALGWHFVTLAQLTHPDAVAVTHK